VWMIDLGDEGPSGGGVAGVLEGGTRAPRPHRYIGCFIGDCIIGSEPVNLTGPNLVWYACILSDSMKFVTVRACTGYNT
jgi:hypothetical protein